MIKEKQMAENIKYYPKSYVMSDELRSFFTAITNDQNLQQEMSRSTHSV